jgi:hypothetical protein
LEKFKIPAYQKSKIIPFNLIMFAVIILGTLLSTFHQMIINNFTSPLYEINALASIHNLMFQIISIIFVGLNIIVDAMEKIHDFDQESEFELFDSSTEESSQISFLLQKLNFEAEKLHSLYSFQLGSRQIDLVRH